MRRAGGIPDLGLLPVLGAADDADEVVEIVESDLVALQDVRALLRLTQAELGAAGDDIAAVLDVAIDQLLDVHLSAASGRAHCSRANRKSRFAKKSRKPRFR